MNSFIDNNSILLGDDLKVELKENSKVKIAASCFSIYAYEALKEELANIDELKFVFTSPTFVTDKISDKVKKESREFYIPKTLRENSLYGTDFEVRLKNQLTQRAIAKECANWIRNKVKFKSVISNINVPTFIDIENNERLVNYCNFTGFTAVDLGYEKGNNLFCNIVKDDDYSHTKQLTKQFLQMWNDKTILDDVTEEVVSYIQTCYKENSPEFIYFVILYNIFNEFLDDIYEDYMPNEATGFKDSLIWNKLYNFQKDGVIGIINKLEKYNGCILADSVGLGKTFTALAVMQYYSLKNKSILVLCPKRLSDNWNSYKGNTKTNIFYKDRIRFDVLYHTDLTRRKGYSNGINLATLNWGNYDLVVIDESHNFRNGNGVDKRKENRYDFLMNHIMKAGINTKVLMLSATPVNNRYNDLKNQLALAYGGDFNKLNQQIETKKTVETIFRNAQKAFNAWSKKPIEERTTKELLDKLDMDFSVLLDSVTIARSRKHIEKYYDVSDIGKFPNRNKVVSLNCKISENSKDISYDEIYDKLDSLNLNVYAPWSMILPSRLESYADKYNINFGTSKFTDSIENRINRESGTKKLAMTLILKRLESSIYAFNITVCRLINKIKDSIKLILEYEKGNRDVVIHKEYYDYVSTNPDDDEDSFDLTRVGEGIDVEIKLRDIDIATWKEDLISDYNLLCSIYAKTKSIEAKNDNKLKTLKRIIDDKIAKPINAGNKKFLIFSAFADTVDYLYKELSEYVLEKYGMYSAKVIGGNSKNASNDGLPLDTDRILTYFSPKSKEKTLIYGNDNKCIDLLIATDCVSEGQNLQDSDICINYDIHWNPVRIVQRFGRIDRIGSNNQSIQMVCFWPDVDLDKYINLKKRVDARMTIVNAAATGSDNLLNDEQELDYRAVQLKKLQNGELQELEDVDGSITITDLGLNEFRMDMLSYIKQHGEPKNIVKGLHAVVKADESKGFEKGVIFVLRNINDGVNIDKQNRLHPYYLVYLKENGEVVSNHLQVKNILDVLRATCNHKSEPLTKLCELFNEETMDGYKMDKYSSLLEDAILSIVEVKDKKDIDSLFSAGGTTALRNDIQGFEEFELIAFVVLK